MEMKRRGIGIGIISRGTVSLKWMMHMNSIKNYFPGGLFWKYITVEGKGYAAARNEVIRLCRANNFKFVCMVDDDVFLPKDALELLLRSGKDIISGIYWTKNEHSSPVIYETIGDGPMYNFEPGKIFPIDSSGLGACLINLNVFDKFDEAGIPYFVENWIRKDEDGNELKYSIGEDHYFFHHAKQFGFQAYAHGGVLCDHYDSEKSKFYPGKEIVEDICKEKLIKEGKEKEVKEFEICEKKVSKGKIVIFNDSVPFSGDEDLKRGIGGSEYDIIELSRSFQRMGYEVVVYCQCPREGIYQGVIYKDRTKFDKEIIEHGADLFITSRNLSPLVNPNLRNHVKQVVLWAHDVAEDPVWYNFEPNLMQNIDYLVALSEFHKKGIMKKFNFVKEEDFLVYRNGVNPDLYKNKVIKMPGKCIYSSTPYRGLELIPLIWSRILKQVPHATLHVFSSMKVYGEMFDDFPWVSLYDKLKDMKGVYYHGTVKHDRLSKEQLTSELMLYPNIFPESCCLNAMETQMAGTPIISSHLGALPEIVDDSGILINCDPSSEEYQDEFVKQSIMILTDKDLWLEKHHICLSKDFSWDTVAKEWLKQFFPKNN